MRRKGKQLQDDFDRFQRDMEAVPANQCMFCRRSNVKLHVTDAAFGDLQSEKETGELVMNGRFKLRWCGDCYKKADAYSRAKGVPIRRLD